MPLPDSIKNQVARWKLHFGKILVLTDNRNIAGSAQLTYYMRPMTAGEYEILLESEGNPVLAPVIESIVLDCLLFPTAAPGDLTEDQFNYLLVNLKEKSGFDSPKELVKFVERERARYDPRLPGTLLRHYRAVLVTQGGLDPADVNKMTFEQILQRLVMVEIITKKPIIQLPGYDERGRKVPQRRNNSGLVQQGPRGNGPFQ